MRTLLIFLIFMSSFFSCSDDYYGSYAKMEVYVTQGGEIPDAYDLDIYYEDKLMKSDEFDREYRGTNNLTEILDPLPGLYYFEASSGSLRIRDSVNVRDFSKVKIVNVDLTK